MSPGIASRSPLRRRPGAGPSALLLVLLAAPVAAQESIMGEYPGDEPLTEERDPWSESKSIEFPAVPREDDLVRLDSEAIRSDYEYYIDPSSVTLGSDDVTRFSVVLESRSGVRNVYYEGLRCETLQSKTYGYAAREGKFKPLAAPSWRRVYHEGPLAYRHLLAEQYVCDANGWPLEVKQVRERIAQYSPSGIRIRPKSPEASD